MIVGRVYVVHATLAKPPKHKITLCMCSAANLFFWINTKSQDHGVGQFPLEAVDHTALTHTCFLDCSRVTTFPQRELDAAQERDAISADLAKRIVEFLQTEPPKTLPPRFVNLAVANLSALVQS